MIRGVCAILAAVLQVVLLYTGTGTQPASCAILAVVLIGGPAWLLFGELFFY